MATVAKVYGRATSTAVSRVLACLLEKDVPFQLVHVENKKPDYRKIQPFGQVPAFQDDDITLFESRAICRYISEKYQNKGTTGLFGTNNDPLIKATIDQWLEVESQSFNPPSSVLAFQLFCAPNLKLKQNAALIRLNEAKLVKVLDIYEKRLGLSRFIAGDDFTLADLSHLPNIQFLVGKTNRGELFTSRKNVGRWWEEISKRPSWKKVIEMQNV